MGSRPQAERVLDGSHVNELWLKLGTLKKVSDALVLEGIVSPRNGKAVSNAGIAMANWRWCIRNPKESYERVNRYRTASGNSITRDEWDLELISHARTALTPAGYEKFLKRNNFEEKARLIR